MTTSVHQKEFDITFISSGELCKDLSICRTSLRNAIITGFLPAPIVINRHMFLWKRDEIAEVVESWRGSLARRRR